MGMLCGMTPRQSLCIGMILLNEGGLVDDPRDPGGLTNLGIAWNAHPELRREDIVGMTPARAAAIYQQQYWQPIRGDDLPLPLALVTFDAAVNSGVQRGAQWLQRAAGAQPDGVIGPVTLSRLRGLDVPTLIRASGACRLEYLQTLPTWRTFGHGWQARVELVRDTALMLAGLA